MQPQETGRAKIAGADCRYLPIGDVRPDASQPRKIFAVAEIEELAASIRELGLLEPILVRPDGNDRFIIVAGDRRHRASQHNKVETILARIVDIAPEDVLTAQIVENYQRAQITPLEEAAAFQRELDKFGGDVNLVAARLGIKQPWRITERTALLNLAPEYSQLLASGNLGNSEAYELSQLSPPGQRKLFTAIRRGLCPNYSALRAAALALREHDLQGSMFEDTGPSEDERQAISSLERKIDQVCRMLAGGFDDGQIVVAKKVAPDRAATYADKLGLIRRHLSQLENALRASAAVSADLLAS